MGLEHVKESILAEARAAAEHEQAQARSEAKAVLARAEEQASQAQQARKGELANAVEALRRRELALAELEAKKLRLRAEKEVLAKVRARAMDRLAKLPAKQNEEYLGALLKKASLQGARVLARPQDKDIIQRLGFHYAGPIEAIGGVVLESPDGTTREDLRYDLLLEEAWRDALGQVAQAALGTKGK